MNIDEIKRALSLSPENIVLREMLAKSYLEKWNYEEAEKEYKKLIDLDPENYEFRLVLTSIFIKEKKYNYADLILDFLIDKNYKLWEIYLLKSKLFKEQWNYKEANSYYYKAVSLDSSIEDEEYESDLQEIKKEKILLDSDAYDYDDYIFYNWETITFDQIWWMEKLKEQIKLKIIYPFEKPEIYEKYNKKIWGWLLLYWPPWCGKTLIAKAVAWELKSKFIHIGLTDILDMYVWESEKKLEKIFRKARENAPTVIFFDEIDALASKRSETSGSIRHIINQLLMELDWISSKNDKLLVIWATNTPWYIDSAFKRPWRFDKIIFVSPPDKKAREEIFKIKLSDKLTKDIDYEKLAKKTEHFSWADIDLVIENALEKKIEESLKTSIILPLETEDLLKEIKKIKPTTLEWFSIAKNYATYANEWWFYDDILKYKI